MSTVNNSTDKVLVNRSGTNYSTSTDMSTVNNTDLLIVNRGGTDYKCTFADWQASQSVAPSIDSVTLTDVAGGNRFTSVSFPLAVTMDNDGIPASTKKIKVSIEAPAYEQGRSGIATQLRYYPQTSAVTSVSASSGNGVVITCSDNTNFNYFELGDYVRLSNSTQTRDYSQDTIDFSSSLGIFDGSSSYTQCGGNWYPDPGISYTSSVRVLGNEPGHGYARFNGTNIYTGGYAWVTLATGSGTMTHFGWYDNRGCAGESIGPLEIDGVILRRNMWQPSGIVTAINPNNNTITVNTNEGVFAAWSATGSPKVVREFKETSTKKSAAELAADPALLDPSRALKLYAIINSSGNITDMVEDDPGWVTLSGSSPYSVTFPATFGTGRAPDSDFPVGSRIIVEIQATNENGDTDKLSNTLVPA